MARRRGRGSRLGISESECKRRKIQQDKIRHQNEHKINLGDAYDDFETLRQRCGFLNSKPAVFVKHLMSLHTCVRSRRPTPTRDEQQTSPQHRSPQPKYPEDSSGSACIGNGSSSHIVCSPPCLTRSIKVVEGKSDDVTEIKPKRLKLESRASSCREPDIVTPNPRTVQAEILKLRREERMNEIMLSLNSIVQKQSDVKASIAAAQSQDNIQEVYDLKVKLEKLTTQQLLLMTEQTDLIKRQRRSDRYYIAKARAEEENGDPTDIFNSHHDPTPAEETKLMIHPVHSDGRMQVQANSVLSAPPRVEDTRTEQGKGLVDTSDTSNTSNTSLAQTLLMQHTLMDEGLRVAQNYAISGKVKVEAGETQQIKSDSQDDVASRDAESTITALLSLSSNKDGTPENSDVTT